MFDNNSRYSSVEQYAVTDRQGRTIQVVGVPPVPGQFFLGYHLLMQGQRIDHLASKYLNNPTGFWRIAELNDVMLVETLTEQQQIAIPQM
jgi:hypothetical protein